MAPSTCQATVPIPDSEGLRRRVTGVCSAPGKMPALDAGLRRHRRG